jgi:hypothetical protein
MTMAAPSIKTSEHVFIAGKTGTGKTFLARHYLAGFMNVYALDTKGVLTWPEIPGTVWTGREGEILKDGHKEIVIVDHFKDFAKAAKEYPKVIYRPNFKEMNLDFYDQFFQYCYFRKDCICWIDEAMSVCPTSYKIPEYYKGILTRGRQLNVAAWSLTQRPSGLPQLIVSESLHFFIFNLNLEADREKLANITGSPVLLDKPGFSTVNGKQIPNFWYYNANQDKAVLSYMLVK